MATRRFDTTICTELAVDYVGVSSNPVAVQEATCGDITITVTDPSPPTELNFIPDDVDDGSGFILIPHHGYITGLRVWFSTEDELPSPLNPETDYFVIVIDADTLAFADSLENALAGSGSALRLNDRGSGNSIITPQGSATATIWVWRSAEPVTPGWPTNSDLLPSSAKFSQFDDLNAQVTLSDTGSIVLNDIGYSWMKIYTTAIDGMPYVTVTGNFKGF